MSIFEEIKEGDRIVIDKGGRGFERITKTLLVIAPVTKVTKTQITAGGLRFSRHDGWEIGPEMRHKARIRDNGKSWGEGRLMTPEEAEAENEKVKRELDRKALAHRIRDIKFTELPYETLLKLAAVLGLEIKSDDNQA